MGSEDPVAISVFPGCVDQNSALHIPDPQSSVFRIGNQQFHSRVEKDAGNVVHVPLQGVHLPVLIARKPP